MLAKLGTMCQDYKDFRIWESWEDQPHYYAHKYTRLPRWVYHRLVWQCKKLYCHHYGHDFEDHSVAGPDSGSIDLYCNRCGYSHHVALY